MFTLHDLVIIFTSWLCYFLGVRSGRKSDGLPYTWSCPEKRCNFRCSASKSKMVDIVKEGHKHV